MEDLNKTQICIIDSKPSDSKIFTKSKFNILKIANTSVRGPQMRVRNLLKGLKLVNQPHKINPRAKEVNGCVHVATDLSALQFALEAKARGEIKYLIAGPTIVSAPPEYGGIINNKNIDLILTASPWVTKMFLRYAPGAKGKIADWAAGVDSEWWHGNKKKKYDFLIYNKADHEMWPSSRHIKIDDWQLSIFNDILAYLKGRYKVAVVNYGSYSRREYRRLLSQSRCLIYLSRHETQGQALFEAWSCDVPSLVWDRGYWTYRDYRYVGSSSAPYLNGSHGMFFYNYENFIKVLPIFVNNYLNNLYKPRNFILNHHTLSHAARNYMNVWNNLLTSRYS